MSATATDPSAFIETAWHIGIDLVRDAIWDEQKGRCTWAGNWMDAVEGKYTSVYKSFGNDLYAGTSGIAFFLAALHSVRPDPLIKKTLEGAVNHTLSLLPGSASFGFYSGKPGIASALIYAGEKTGKEAWINAGLSTLASLKDAEVGTFDIDIISGIAGTIPCLVNSAVQYQDEQLMDIATRLGNTLCERAVISAQGWSWTTLPGTKNLTGYSHGSSGIATSLLQLYAQTKDASYLEAAEGGFQYEKSHFDEARRNWPDFRENFEKTDAGKHNFGMSWCHGAPGIALSRIRASRLKDDPEYKRVAEIALDTTLRDTNQMLAQPAYTPNFSLCHGIAGNADILLESGRVQDHDSALATGRMGIENYDQQRATWPSGTLDAKPTPGLMMGIAGTGYFYLRLSDPAQFRTILLPEI